MKELIKRLVADTRDCLLKKAQFMRVETNCEYVGIEIVVKFYTNRDNSKLSCIGDYELFPLKQNNIEEFCSKPNRFIINL